MPCTTAWDSRPGRRASTPNPNPDPHLSPFTPTLTPTFHPHPHPSPTPTPTPTPSPHPNRRAAQQIDSWLMETLTGASAAAYLSIGTPEYERVWVGGWAMAAGIRGATALATSSPSPNPNPREPYP